jgi:hypothetical protein
MKIDGTEFGSITISGKTYDHDVVIRLSPLRGLCPDVVC